MSSSPRKAPKTGGKGQGAKSPPKIRTCRVCGCTDDDCRQCIGKTGGPCHWVEKDLCSACAEPRLLPPVIRIDANYLHGIALNVRRHIQQTVLPGLLEVMVQEANRGQLECLFIPEVRGLDPITCCEALQPELLRLGIRSEIVRHEIPRVGMIETKTALAVSWRKTS